MSLIERVNSHILPNLAGYLSSWLPDGKVEANEFVARNPRRSDAKHGSFKINIRTCVWKDFALNDKGGNDAVSLYAYIKGISMGQAAKELARQLSLPSERPAEAPAQKAKPLAALDEWEVILPVPEEAPEPVFRATHGVHPYRNEKGELLYYVERFASNSPTGKCKPLSFCRNLKTGVLQWHRKWPLAPRTLYGLEFLAQNPTGAVLLSEGEKKTEAARRLLPPRAIAMGWPGGSAGVRHVDWSPLKGHKVYIWPDNDAAGLKAAEIAAELIFPHATEVIIVPPPEGVREKWDLADAEAEGWDQERLVAYIRAAGRKWEPKAEEPKPEIIIDSGLPAVSQLPPDTVSWEGEDLVSKESNKNLPSKDSNSSAELAEPEVSPSDEVELSVEMLKEKMAKLSTAERQATNLKKHSEFSRTLAAQVQRLALYDEFQQRWFTFRKVWTPTTEGTIRRMIVGLLDSHFMEGWNMERLNGVYNLLRVRLGRSSEVEHGKLAESDSWNSDSSLLPMANGVLSLKTKELLPHSPELMMNWFIPYDFDPKADCPTIKQFLKNLAQGNDATEDVLKAFLWAILRGRADLQKYLELQGRPGTGKSTFIKLAADLVGKENVVTTTMKNLSESRFETANFYGKRLAVITDADKYAGSIDTFKSVTGQDPVRFEEKQKQAVKHFIFGGLVIVAANEPIQFSDQSTAMLRRRIPVHFDKSFDVSQRDPNLIEKMMAEMSGLVNMLLAIDESWAVERLTDVKQIRQHEAMRALIDTNTVADWLNQNVIYSQGDKNKVGCLIRSQAGIENADEWLYPNFVRFVERSGRKAPVALKTFSRAVVEILETAGYKVEHRRVADGVMLYNIRLRRASSWTDRAIPTPLLGETLSGEDGSYADPLDGDMPATLM